MRRTLRHGSLLLLALALLGGACGDRLRADPDLAPLALGGDFTLDGPGGTRFSSSAFRGKVMLLLFGYRSCPDACPHTLSRIATAYERIERARLADHLRTVFVSIDPERDTPEALATYLSSFAVPVLGVTGEAAAVERTVRQWGAFRRPILPSGPTSDRRFEHTRHVYLVDTVGRVRHLFRPEDTPERIAEVIELLMDQEGCLPRVRR